MDKDISDSRIWLIWENGKIETYIKGAKLRI